MPDPNSNRSLTRTIMALFCLILPVLAFIVWEQALDFDPCNNILKNPGSDCLESGAGGIGAGALVAIVGLGIVQGAVTKGFAVYGSRLEQSMMIWIGMALAVTGAGIIYAGFSVGF